MKFKMYSKIFFEAKNIDDAFKKLSKHFKDISNGKEGLEMLPNSLIKIQPIK